MALVLAATLSSACRDAPTDPMVGVVAEESAAALALDVSFADPRSLVDPASPLGARDEALLEGWQDSWDLGLEDGRAVRGALYPRLAHLLAPGVDTDDLNRELGTLAEALRRARETPLATSLSSLAEGMDRAAVRYEAAVAAVGRGDTEAAVSMILRSGDALREVGPEAIARGLHEEVEAAFRRISPADPYSSQDLERIERLVHGSREAVEQGAWVLAIRRAYYARALLDAAHGG